jgi:hypothetical protein
MLPWVMKNMCDAVHGRLRHNVQHGHISVDKVHTSNKEHSQQLHGMSSASKEQLHNCSMLLEQPLFVRCTYVLGAALCRQCAALTYKRSKGTSKEHHKFIIRQGICSYQTSGIPLHRTKKRPQVDIKLPSPNQWSLRCRHPTSTSPDSSDNKAETCFGSAALWHHR